MGFKPNYRKKFNISNCLENQLQEAFEKPITISGQFLGIRNIHHGSFNKRTVIFSRALLHKDLKCKAPLIEPNLRRNLGKWST